jgi:predicted extracellular nuclease
MFSDNRKRQFYCLAPLTVLAILGGLGQPQAHATGSSSVVISQVYGGGGNSGATYTNDYVELFNRSSSPVDVTGWTVQYASAAGSSWQKTALSGTIAPGHYYLVQESQGAAGTTPLPTPQAVGTIPMSATSGKIALVSDSTTIVSGVTCPVGGADVVDFVGFGGTSCSETAPTAGLSNTTAALRALNGCTDTDNNSSDFAVTGPIPRNSATAANICSASTTPTVTTTTPASGASSVAVNANITVFFSQPVNVSGAWFTIMGASSGAHTASVSGGPTMYTLNPDADFTPGESVTVKIVGAQVTAQTGGAAMASDYTTSFTTQAVTTVTHIHDIQGAAHISPLNNTQVTNVQGIVTAVDSNGFYMQDMAPDANDATSEGIFVFTSSAPGQTVGNLVAVSGRISEFRPGNAATNLTTTEIGSPTVSTISSSNPLPTPIVIGLGGRVPPTTIIEDDASNVETNGVFDIANDGIDFYESLEGMRVQVNDPVASGPTNSFGEVSVLPDNGVNASVRTPRGGIIIRPTDFNPERIILGSALTSVPSVNVGDHFSGPAIGVLSYNFGNFMLEVTSPLTGVSGGLTREITDAPSLGQLTAATFNFENLAPSDPQSKFDRLASLIVNNLRAPDVISAEEIQDNTGATDNGVVDASTTVGKLVAAIQEAGGPTYQYRSIDPVNDQDGGQPGGNIRVGFLYRTDRGLSFIERPGAGSLMPNAVIGSGAATQLQYSPGRIDPTNSAFNSSRKPLAGEFVYNGRKLFVIVNHFNSKGGDEPLYGPNQPPARISETQRHQQAQIVNSFVANLLTADPKANVIVLGDLNDFEFSDTLTILTSGGVLADLVNTLPQPERYTYVFEGNSQVLDHILVSPNLVNTAAPVYDIVHVNSEFADQASDHEPSLVRLGVPTAGVVIGNGAFASAAGAAPGSPTASGSARFSVTAQYASGAAQPSGKVQLNLASANLNFQSTSVQSLITTGATALIQGVGTVNGVSGYQFSATVTDAQATGGGGGSDKIRVRITGFGVIVYDNQSGAAVSAAPTQPISSGSIMVSGN